MNYRHLLSAAACAAALGMVGCSSNPTNAQIGTGVGAVAGGVVGSALGGTAATVGTNWAKTATAARVAAKATEPKQPLALAQWAQAAT
jgi:osmotically inducible lipoprotein OsmB